MALAKMIPKVKEKIEELFVTASGSLGSVDFKSVCKLFWVCLDNSVSIVDLSGLFAVTVPNGGAENLGPELFHEFFKALARVKYPTGIDYCEKLLEELKNAKSLRVSSELPSFATMMDKNVIKILLKFDLPIRKAYSNFCGQSVRVGGVLSWEEVRSLQIGMEIGGFISFAGAYSLIPEHLSTQQCELMFRDVLNRFPVVSPPGAPPNTFIMFPQFQLLLMMIATEKNENASRKDSKTNTATTPFAKKVTDGKNKPLSEALFELLRDIGISKIDETLMVVTEQMKSRLIVPDHMTDTLLEAEARLAASQFNNQQNHHQMGNTSRVQNAMTHPVNMEPNLFSNTVVLPQSNKPGDMYSSSFHHSRQAMLLRMEHLFDEVESKVMDYITPDSNVLVLLAQQQNEEIFERKARLPSKPVVIGDAIPVPAKCPDNIEQLLEAALAHHNLGSYEDSLKFLEAARIHLIEADHHTKIDIASGGDKKLLSLGSETAVRPASSDYGTIMALDIDMYITLCKGNVYQSCGDDEQSLLHYMEAWTKSKKKGDKDWEVIAINSVGTLAFYNLRYDIALLCFHAVTTYREKEYGEENVDTATSWNNEACCLYCLNKRSEARVRFERAWNTISQTVGHRAPRAITAWKNLEKARRAHAPLRNVKDMNESIQMRPDADRLLMGGTFTIQALAPPEMKKKKGKVGGKKKKKG